MMLKIISTTDGRFIGTEFEPVFPLLLGDDFGFSPDKAVPLSAVSTRFFNSNYCIDAEEI
jgi:hypothetical protein